MAAKVGMRVGGGMISGAMEELTTIATAICEVSTAMLAQKTHAIPILEMSNDDKEKVFVSGVGAAVATAMAVMVTVLQEEYRSIPVPVHGTTVMILLTTSAMNKMTWSVSLEMKQLVAATAQVAATEVHWRIYGRHHATTVEMTAEIGKAPGTKAARRWGTTGIGGERMGTGTVAMPAEDSPGAVAGAGTGQETAQETGPGTGPGNVQQGTGQKNRIVLGLGLAQAIRPAAAMRGEITP